MKKFLMMVMVMAVLAITAGAALANEDGRWLKNASSLAVVYQQNEVYEVWSYDVASETGLKAFEISMDNVQDAVQQAVNSGENQLIEQEGDISFWALSTEECQINSVYPNGETEEFIFACPLAEDEDAA